MNNFNINEIAPAQDIPEGIQKAVVCIIEESHFYGSARLEECTKWTVKLKLEDSGRWVTANLYQTRRTMWAMLAFLKACRIYPDSRGFVDLDRIQETKQERIWVKLERHGKYVDVKKWYPKNPNTDKFEYDEAPEGYTGEIIPQIQKDRRTPRLEDARIEDVENDGRIQDEDDDKTEATYDGQPRDLLGFIMEGGVS